MANILVTCAGTGVGQSIIDSLLLSRKHKIIGCDANRNVYGNHFCDKFFVVPPLYSEEYLPFILDICTKEKVDLIIPGHDHELLILSKNILLFNNKGIEVIVSLPDLIEISRDKLLWYKFFENYGCNIVPTYRVIDFKANPDESIFPAIVKPSSGSASQGIKIINSLEELESVNDVDIIQTYLFPTSNDSNFDTIKKVVSLGKFVQMSEISIQLIFTKESKLAGIFISKNVLNNGVPTHIDPIQPEDFEYLDEIMKFVQVCIDKSVKGPVNIQGRITENGLVCFEMNMRFTGITGNRAQLGFNEVDFLVDNFLGIPSTMNGYSSNKFGVRQVGCTTITRSDKTPSKGYNYCILGAGSNIGSVFIKELIEKKNYQNIFIICRESSYKKYNELFSSMSGVKIIKETDKLTESAYSQTDILINFVGALAFNEQSLIYDAIIFLHKQINRIIRANIPFIINISSQSVYNQLDNVEKDENKEVVLNSLYAFQKHFTELLFDSVHGYTPSSKIVSLRLPRVLGDNLSDIRLNGFFLSVINAIKDKEELHIQNPMNKTNLIDIKDVITAINHIIKIENRNELPTCLNVSGFNISLNDYCHLTSKCLKIPLEDTNIRISTETKITSSAMIDGARLETLGWEKQISLNDTILSLSRISKSNPAE